LGGGVGTGAGGDRRSQACRIVGKYQSVLIMINPMIFTRTHRFEETLTGFKWMGERAAQLRAEGRTVLLAYEEAIGFCVGDVLKDKDGVAAMVLATAARCLALPHPPPV
jgi:phosphomannomutase